MYTNNQDSITNPLTEELRVNGLSLVFYDVYLLKQQLTQIQISTMISSSDFTLININNGYNNKIFYKPLHGNITEKHMIFKYNSVSKLPMISIENVNSESSKHVSPVVRHYLIVYNKNTVVIQSVIVFDKNEISGFNDANVINYSLSTSDILCILSNIKTKDQDGYKSMHDEVNTIINLLKKTINDSSIIDTNSEDDEDNESVGIQIWDIERLETTKDVILGKELEDKYQRELSALMNYKNEHIIAGDMWRLQSEDSIKENMQRHTDVLNDHRILQSDRVCIEISQVDYPELRSISAIRLQIYGYDSTSVFLWNYIQIIKKYYSRYRFEISDLRSRVHELLDLSTEELVAEEASIITKKKTELYREVEIHNRIKNSCFEFRHRKFIEHGMEATGLDLIYENLKDIFHQITEGVSVTLSAQTSYINSEMRSILSEIEEINKTTSDRNDEMKSIMCDIKEINKIQSKLSTILSIVAIIFAFPSVLTLADYITSFYNNRLDTIFGKIGALLFSLIIISLLLRVALKFTRNKSKGNQKNGTNETNNETS